MRRSMIFLLIIPVIMFCTSIFVVQEGQCSIVFRFRKILQDKENKTLIYNPGLHIKIPFIDTIKNFDSRIQTIDNQYDRFITTEKKDIIIDFYIKWKISNFSRYYLATGGGDISQAELLLKQKFSDRLRTELEKIDIRKIVTDSKNQLMINIRDSLNYGTSKNRKKLEIIKNNYLSKKTKDTISIHQKGNNISSMEILGIEVIDIRIKQINFPTEISDAIYQRMRSERAAIALYYRSKGQEKAEKIRAISNYQVAKTLSEAKRQSSILHGEADSEIAKLYFDAFGKDQEFYFFIRSLLAYEKIFHENNNILLLSIKNDFFDYMKKPK